MIPVIGEEWNLELTGIKESATVSFGAEIGSGTIHSVLHDFHSVVEYIHSFS